MQYSITAPKTIDARIVLPASKSISNRALIISGLSYSGIPVQNLSESDDTQVLLKALNSNSNVFDVGPAGTAMRFITAFLSKIMGEWVVTGSERMKNRPIKILVDALNELGARIEYMEKEGYPPLKIYGSALYSKTLELEGNISSQYISALLMIGPTVQGGLTLKLKNKIISKPYIRMTLRMMEYFGVKAEWEGDTITIAQQNYKPREFFVEPDWSAASYWYQMVSLVPGAKVEIPDLIKESYQGDSRCGELFEQLGVKTTYSDEGAVLENSGSTVEKLDVDFVDQPDLAQTFVVTCALKGIPFYFKGLHSLKIKETNRVAALIKELGKMGFVITEPEEGCMAWDGSTSEKKENIAIDTYEDHRMAMAFAPAAVMLPGIIINEPGVVSKSYPGYWKDLGLAGFNVIEQ
ncbi:3-phosphoshikimate 1-carboxyvinyltransferase [Saccharicrinis sp. FJH2]|uniref:3-phosphoshikimate 1-carboxyvinyltransferase n=1 Tax=Saccharicrinis sp. FJH65 TaxID=3344659 RepID=UPI0035F45C52